LTKIITIDGPSASGKGSLGTRVAKALGFKYLDSGAIYRALALECLSYAPSAQQLQDEIVILRRAERLAFGFDCNGLPLLRGIDVSEEIRSEEAGTVASMISRYPKVRAELLAYQLSFAEGVGLVADGRDMGTEVFPLADLKIFVQPPAHTRGEWRAKQLVSRGAPNVNQLKVTLDIMSRDDADRNRVSSPLRPASDAVIFDNSMMDINSGVSYILELWKDLTASAAK
jgi:cytidylate kinase